MTAANIKFDDGPIRDVYDDVGRWRAVRWYGCMKRNCNLTAGRTYHTNDEFAVLRFFPLREGWCRGDREPRTRLCCYGISISNDRRFSHHHIRSSCEWRFQEKPFDIRIGVSLRKIAEANLTSCGCGGPLGRSYGL